MKAVVLERPGQFSMVDMEPPEKPRLGEAAVAVRDVGICGSDLGALQGEHPFFSYPRIIGHEFGVEIEAVGENEKGLAVGDRCTVQPYRSCGSCIACRRGKTNCFINLKFLGVHIDGGMRHSPTGPPPTGPPGVKRRAKSQRINWAGTLPISDRAGTRLAVCSCSRSATAASRS